MQEGRVCSCEGEAAKVLARAAANLAQVCQRRIQACAPGKIIAVEFSRIITYHQKFIAEERRKISYGLARDDASSRAAREEGGTT